MMLTFAEVHFLASLVTDPGGAAAGADDGAADHVPDRLPAPALLDLARVFDQEPTADADLAAIGAATLIERGWCTDHTSHGVRVVSLAPTLLELHGALHGATGWVRVVSLGPTRSAWWAIVSGITRAVFTPAGSAGFHAVPISGDVASGRQVSALVLSALDDDPFAGIAIVRGGDAEAMSFRTNAEFGGPDAGAGERLARVEELVGEVFADQAPTRG